MVQMFFNKDAIFQEDNPHTHTARNVQSWFQEHEDALHLPYQHNCWTYQTTVVTF